MDPVIVVALVAAAVSLATSAASLYRQKQLAEQQRKSEKGLVCLRHDLDQRTAREDRERNEAEQLNLYREPLLFAAKELTHQIEYIRKGNYLDYLNGGDPHRSRIALLGTLYRLGTYWATVASLYGTVNLLRFEQNTATAHIAEILDETEGVFARDGDDYGGAALMVWREEQRAIAELMQRYAPEGRTVIGFATFVQRYDDDFAPWFQGWERDLTSPGVESSPRLQVLQTLTSRLIVELETDRT
jgi:hypothetical protein